MGGQRTETYRNKWIGRGRRSKRGREYDAFERAGLQYRVGDVIRTHADEDARVAGKKLNYYLARIERLWGNEDDDHLMLLRWFYFPEETQGGRAKGDGAREVAWSNHQDENFAETVMGHAAVVGEREFEAWRKAGAQGAQRGGSAAQRAAAGRGAAANKQWTLDWRLPQHDARVPLFFCKSSYNAKTCKRSRVPWPPQDRGSGAAAAASAASAGRKRPRKQGAAAGAGDEGEEEESDSSSSSSGGESSASEASVASAESEEEAEEDEGEKGPRAPAKRQRRASGAQPKKGGRQQRGQAGSASRRRPSSAAARGPRQRRASAGAEAASEEEEEEEEEEEGESDLESEREEIAHAVERLAMPDRLQRACKLLQLSAVPTQLPCREAERAKIRDFLASAIARRGAHSALYLSGMPGTGKTATVKEVVRELRRRTGHHRLPKFKFVEVNAMKLAHPYHAYTEIWQALTGQHAPPHRAAQLLDGRFSAPPKRSRCVVLLADELDFLVTRKQSVLYNLFDWPSRPNSKLVVVGVANTMDLPERLLPRISSRLGMARTVFQPYSVPQIEAIVRNRVGALGVFDPDALQMCARKVASVSGDVRRALMICRRAAEIVLQRADSQRRPAEGGDDEDEEGGSEEQQQQIARVGLHVINQAARELNASHHLQVMAHGSPFEQLLLTTVVLQMRASGLDFAAFEDLYPRFLTLWRTQGEAGDPPTAVELLEVMDRLASLRLLVLEPAPTERFPMVRLNVQAEDVVFALRDSRVGACLQQQ